MFVRCTTSEVLQITKDKIYKVLEIKESNEIFEEDMYRVIDDTGRLNGWYASRFEEYHIQAGDVVKINEDLCMDNNYDINLVDSMLIYAGQESVVLEVVDQYDNGFSYDLQIDSNSFSWSEDMFCEVTTSNTIKKIKEVKKEDNIFELFNT